MVCPHGQGGGFSQCGHFADKGSGGQFFAILCGRLLWTARKHCLVEYQSYKTLNKTLF